MNILETDERIAEISKKVVNAAKEALGDKLDKVILYGSYARGDFDNESDIDFLILADVPQKEATKWWRCIGSYMPQISLEYDLLVSTGVTNRDLFNQYIDDLPFYRNVFNEGMVLYGKW